MEMDNYSVYAHVFPNEKIYIGLTSKEPEKRWKNGNGYRNQKLMWRAIQKYGWNNIEHIIIDSNLTRLDAENLEIQLIKEFNSNDNNKGYNISTGGESANGHILTNETKHQLSIVNTGKTLSNETKNKISNTLKGIRRSEDTKEKMRIAKIGENNPNYNKRGVNNSFYGYKFSEKSKEKMSIAHKGKKLSESTKKKLSEQRKGIKHPLIRSVICVETGIIYDYIRQASELTHISESHISQVCSGKRKSAGGYHWKYYIKDCA